MKQKWHVDIDNIHDPFSKAIALQRRLLLQPTQPDDLVYYAALCIVDCQFEEAQRVLDECLARWPDNAFAKHQK